MTDTNAIQRIKEHADSLESVPHNKQFRSDLYALIEAATATPPADAALADELLRLAGAFDMSLNNAASVSMNRRAADSLRKTLMQAAAALRALAVPEAVAKYRHHLALLRDDCTYTAGHVGSVVLNGHRMEIIRDALSAMLAASKGQKP